MTINWNSRFFSPLGAMLLMPALACANSFSWTFGGSSDPFTASGTLEADPIAGTGNYLITGGRGSLHVNDLVATGESGVSVDLTGQTFGLALLPGGNDSGGLYWTPEDADGTELGYDNLLIGGTSLDSAGIVLTATDPATGNTLYFGLGPNNTVFEDLPDGTGWNVLNLAGEFVATPIGGGGHQSPDTPEPSTIALGSLALTGLVLRRRFRRAAD